tara:strand:+ start:5365 stop:6801 length:1437 start_codon:yes stop_codon:yes gene_type:complete
MDIDNANGFSLLGLSKINVILGKNGCGKSYLLKQVEEWTSARPEFGRVRYISPERGGSLVYEPGIDQNIAQDPNWVQHQRRQNQSNNFRQTSATLFRRLEFLILREIERDHTKEDYIPKNFDGTIEKLNTLLDRVKLVRDDTKAFRIVVKDTEVEASPQDISSGEAELISLGIEFLAFVRECVSGKENLLLVDEPDVHLHPDLQDRLARFIVGILPSRDMKVVLATHSTPLLAGLSEESATRIAFMKRGDSTLTFRPVTEVDKTILPIFGAHPLSNVFNKTPIVLVEGEDDERIWQQAVRSSNGRLRIYPCVVESITRLSEFETEVNNLIDAIYDNATAFSIRDRDLQPELIEDVGHIVRARLSCRAAENLMLSNEVLAFAGSDWITMQDSLRRWSVANTGHQYQAEVQSFIDADFPRKIADLKNIRNILVGLVSNKPWEVLVGRSIAGLQTTGGAGGDGSLRDYLGEKICTQILRLA